MARDRNKPVHVGGAWRLLLSDLGLSKLAVLRRAGLPPGLLEGEGSYISLDDWHALHEAVEAESGLPDLALRAGRVVSLELFDPALFGALCSPDLNTAATRLGQFKRLVGAFSLDVEVGPERTRIGFRCKQRPDVQRNHGLAELVFLTALTRRATRHEVRPIEVSVQRLPDDLAPYEAWFGCPLVVGEHFALVFSAADGARPFLTRNARMWQTFEPSLRLRMAEAAESRTTRERVESALLELLPSGRSQMSAVARELGIGSRTLQRRLAGEGTTWLEVLNGTRERLARHYLATTRMSPAEVSFLLGFEDPNSLFRAFQRWTGTTPETWRARATG